MLPISSPSVPLLLIQIGPSTSTRRSPLSSPFGHINPALILPSNSLPLPRPLDLRIQPRKMVIDVALGLATRFLQYQSSELAPHPISSQPQFPHIPSASNSHAAPPTKQTDAKKKERCAHVPYHPYTSATAALAPRTPASRRPRTPSS